MEGVEHRDVALFFTGLVALLGAGVHLPAEAGHETGGADHPDGIFNEAVVADQAKLTILDVGDAVERIHEEAVGAVVEGERHSIGGEVPAAEIVEDSGWFDDGFAGLGVGDRECAADLNADAARKTDEEGLASFMLPGDSALDFFYIFLEFEGISLNYYIEIAYGRPTGHVAHSSAYEEDGKAFSTSHLTYSKQRSLLSLRKTIFQQINVVGHNW